MFFYLDCFVPCNDDATVPVIASPRSNPDVLICAWIASFLAMTMQQFPSLRAREAIQKPDLHLDCFASSQWRC